MSKGLSPEGVLVETTEPHPSCIWSKGGVSGGSWQLDKGGQPGQVVQQ